MILADDDFGSIFKIIRAEKEKADYASKKEANKAIKHFEKAKSFPSFHYSFYTVPSSNNTYLLWYYAMTEKEASSYNFFYGNSLILNDKKGHRVAFLCRRFRDEDGHQGYSLQVFTGHFFSRYRERNKLGIKLDAYGLMTTFFGRNVPYMYRLPIDKLNIKHEKYGDSSSAWRIEDGVTLGTDYEFVPEGGGIVHVSKHNTFLSESILKDKQKEHVPSNTFLREVILDNIRKKYGEFQ